MAVRMTSLSFLLSVFIFSIVMPVSVLAADCGECAKKEAVGKPDPCGVHAPVGFCNDLAWKKLGRGACNMLTFPLEIPNQISRTNYSDGPLAAFTWGLIKGVGMTAFRAIVGVYEVITFPAPVPEGYKPILTQPEFFFEDQIC